MSPHRPAVFQKPAEPYQPRGRLDPAGFEQNVSFQARPPCEASRPFVDHFWIIRWDLKEEAFHSSEVMHRPYVDVFLSRDWSGIQGTFRGRRVYEAKAIGRLVGARFLPGAFRSFWPGTISDLQDKYLPVSALFEGMNQAAVNKTLEDEDERVIERLEELLLLKKPKADDNISMVNAIIRAVEEDGSLSTVAAVSARFGYSERWLQQLFRTYVGIGLKWFLQRHRLLLAAESIRECEVPDWAGMAYDLGYSSQQHFITDFRKVLGETPLQYKASLARPPSVNPAKQ